VGCAHAPTRELKNAPRVASLRIEGAHALSPKVLTQHLATANHFEPTTWMADLQRIVRVYQTYGYYGARVVAHEERKLPNGEMALSVKVHEGNPTRITAIEIKGLESLPEDDRRQVLKDFPLKQGAILHESDWEGLRTRLAGRLEDLGYAEAVVDGEIRVLAEAQEAHVSIRITPGDLYTFGETVVVTHPAPKVGVAPIVAAAEAAASPGSRFSRKALALVQLRVFQLGVFDSVEVAPGPPDRARGRVGILVDVREAPFHEVRLGGGIGLEPARNELHALAQYRDRDFFGGVRRLTLSLIGGVAFVPDVIAAASNDVARAPFTAPFLDATASLEQPQFLANTLQGFVSLEGQRGVEQAYAFWGADLALGMVWQPSAPLSVRFGYHLGVSRFDSPWALTQAQEAGAFGCPVTCHLSYVEQLFQWDKRDNPIEPKHGYTLGLQLREVGGPLGGAGSLMQVMPQVRAYFTPEALERWTLAGRLLFGASLHTSDEPVPIPLRFFSGGAQSMRGFGYHRLSPMLVVPREASGGNAGGTVPVGGDGLLEASVELRFRLNANLTLATFVDAGAVTQDRLSFHPGDLADELQWALGVGARYRTPLGPLRLDLAWRPPLGSPLPISQLDGEQLSYPTGSACFGFGNAGRTRAGSPEGACAIHLTLGESF
jgi:translocation and assembly module TamA